MFSEEKSKPTRYHLVFTKVFFPFKIKVLYFLEVELNDNLHTYFFNSLKKFKGKIKIEPLIFKAKVTLNIGIDHNNII